MIKREIIRYSDTDRYIDADWLYSRERQEDGEINQIVDETRILWEDIKNDANTKKM